MFAKVLHFLATTKKSTFNFLLKTASLYYKYNTFKYRLIKNGYTTLYQLKKRRNLAKISIY